MANDLTSPLGRFCLGLETFRRTSEGRVRGARELVTHFFPHGPEGAADQIFRHLPREVRGPILSEWKIRGPKAALKDDDAKVEEVVHDAFVAGDLTDAAFEEGLTAETIVRFAPLSEWWIFWRGDAPASAGGRALSEAALLRALTSAYDLALFDAAWFFEALHTPAAAGKPALTGTDVLAEGLSKADLTEWVRRVRESGDGSPKGLLDGIGWEKIVKQTGAPVLIGALDALAQKLGLRVEAAVKDPLAVLEDIETTVVTKGSLTSTGAQPVLKDPPPG